MPNLDLIRARFDQLVALATQVVESKHHVGGVLFGYWVVDSAPFHELRAAGLSLLSQTFGENNIHFKATQAAGDDPTPATAARLLGVLKAAQKDVQLGFLSSLRQLQNS